jgi:hypothetical protein
MWRFSVFSGLISGGLSLLSDIDRFICGLVVETESGTDPD